jgi:hypothetical protein
MQKQQTRTFAAPLKGDPKPDHIHILHASSQPLNQSARAQIARFSRPRQDSNTRKPHGRRFA